MPDETSLDNWHSTVYSIQFKIQTFMEVTDIDNNKRHYAKILLKQWD